MAFINGFRCNKEAGKQTSQQDPRNLWCVIVCPVQGAYKQSGIVKRHVKNRTGLPKSYNTFFKFQIYLEKDRAVKEGKDDKKTKCNVWIFRSELEVIWLGRPERKAVVKEVEERRNGCYSKSLLVLSFPMRFSGFTLSANTLILLQIYVLRKAEMQTGDEHSKQLQCVNCTVWDTVAPNLLLPSSNK